jgi:hypothetical protein
MKRRAFIGGFGALAAAWPLRARAQAVVRTIGPMEIAAQQGDRTRRIGVLMGIGENDPEAKPRREALENGFKELGGQMAMSTEHGSLQGRSSSSNQMSSSSIVRRQSKNCVS